MAEQVKAYVVGATEECEHMAGSKLLTCSKCPTKVWVSPHNLDKTPICFPCAIKIPKAEFKLAKKDVDEACKHIASRN